MAKRAPDKLLKPDSLRDVRIAISVSESPDLARLGLVETHFRLALGELARSVLVSGGKLAYGGHLGPDGYTAMLMKELQRYNRRDRPLTVYLAWQEHRRLSKAELQKQVEELGLAGEIIFLGINGQPIQQSEREEDTPVSETDPEICRRALSALRSYMAQHTSGRVIIGGKRSDFDGDMPGVLEEAIASIEMRQPLYVVGGFGGIASDIAVRAGRLNPDWLPPKFQANSPDYRVSAGLDRLFHLGGERGWPDNGLSDGENAVLAATYRPSEIAALVSLGLGRRFARKQMAAPRRRARVKQRVTKRPRKRN